MVKRKFCVRDMSQTAGISAFYVKINTLIMDFASRAPEIDGAAIFDLWSDHPIKMPDQNSGLEDDAMPQCLTPRRWKSVAPACLLALVSTLGLAAPAVAQTATPAATGTPMEQFVPIAIYRTGPYAPGGSGIYGAYADFLALVNARHGGVKGVKLV